MDLLQLKIQKDCNTTKYIKLIREFDNCLSIENIKRKIESNDFVLQFDLEYFDVLEEISGIDRKENFRSLITKLCNLCAQIEIYQNDEMITLEFLDNWLTTLDEIKYQVEKDMERELADK